MKLRQGVVVATHPEDHSVDLVMLDDGSRMVGVQILSTSGSGRTGTFDMAPVTREGDKWDISKRTDQDQLAVVGFINTHPVVVGFLFPQINQIARKTDKSYYFRHHSDVEFKVNERGAIMVRHPGGLTIRVGTTVGEEAEDDSSFDASSIDRNLDTMPNFSMVIEGGEEGKTAFRIRVTEHGQVCVETQRGVTVQAERKIQFVTDAEFEVRASSVIMETSQLSVSGDVVTGDGVSLNSHVHTGVTEGPDVSGGPVSGGGPDIEIVVTPECANG